MPAKKATKAKAPLFGLLTGAKAAKLGDAAPSGDDVVAVPFSQYGCTAHKVHKPTPSASRIYRIFPAAAQREVWGDIRDHDRVALCGTGAVDAAYAFSALQLGKTLPRGVGLAEAAVAREGFKRYQAAKVQP